MDRRTVASGLAAVAAVVFVAVAIIEDIGVALSWRELLPGVAGLVVAAAIPLVGAILVARRRDEGVAVLVTAALVGLPGILSLGSLLVSSPDDAAGVLLVGVLAIVGAGLAAWGLRDPQRWRWDHPVLLPFVALAVVVALPGVMVLVTLHGALFAIAMVADPNLFELSWLLHPGMLAGLLVWAARLPRRTAAVVLLVLLTPRLFSSLDVVLHAGSVGGVTTDPFAVLGLAAEAALIAAACWWLTRADDLPNRPADPETARHVTG
ncbi:MAG: hypothetical protein JJT89_18110 [Nitriliruptoraceae bacterium]|nr:hypothetical protein [Nitriliruptoraceae bacterium]